MEQPEAKFRLVRASRKEDIAAIARLFTAYARTLGIDLSYQNFDEELAGLPGQYAPPTGDLLLAYSTAEPPTVLGCVAVRPAKDSKTRCEIKRLYVCPEARGLGLGGALIAGVVRAAAKLGYHELVLDTLPTMGSAIRLYEKTGFCEIPAYYDTPILGTKFYKLDLTAAEVPA